MQERFIIYTPVRGMYLANHYCGIGMIRVSPHRHEALVFETEDEAEAMLEILPAGDRWRIARKEQTDEAC